MGEISWIEINRCDPAGRIQGPGGGLINSGVLSVTREGGNADGL